jgi:hypothetical protein
VSAPRQKKKEIDKINNTKLFFAPDQALERSFTRLHAKRQHPRAAASPLSLALQEKR